MSIDELLDVGKKLSLRLHRLGIERTNTEIATALFREADQDLNRALFLGEGLVNKELRLQWLMEITAPVLFSRED